jgi:hypothetical protein
MQRFGFAGWMILPLAAAVVLVWGSPLAPDLDLYLHLKTGELISAAHRLPKGDLFTFTSTGVPDEVHSWLSQVIFFQVFQHAGTTGLKLLNVALVFSTLLLVFFYVGRATKQWGFAACLAAWALLVHHDLQVLRPLLFGEFFFALFSLWLLCEVKPLTVPRLAGALGVAFLWANLHGSVLLVVPLFCFHALAVGLNHWLFPPSQKQIPWWSLLSPILALGVICLNPNGPRIFKTALQISEVGHLSGIWEWRSGWPFELREQFPPPSHLWIGLSARHLWLWVGTPLLFFRLFQWEKKQGVLRLYRVVVSLFCLIMAIGALRHTAYLPASLALGSFELWALVRWPRLSLRGQNLSWLAALVAILFAGRFYESGFALTSVTESVRFLRAAGVEGKILNFPGWGSYLLYSLYPKVHIACDRRLLVNRAYYEKEHAQTQAYGGLVLADLVKSYPTSDLVMMHSSIALIELLGAKDWMLVYENNEVAIALKRSEANAKNLEGITQYYQARKIPFDPTLGFSPALALRAAPAWVSENLETVDWGWFADRQKKKDFEAQTENYMRRLKTAKG